MSSAKNSGSISLKGQDIFHGKPSEAQWVWDHALGESELEWPGQKARIVRSQFHQFHPKAARQTILEWDANPNQRLEHCEHAFAAWLFFAHLPIRLVAVTETLPLLDGSAQPWRDALFQLAKEQNQIPQPPREYGCDMHYSEAWENGYLRAEPASHFSVTYEIERNEFQSIYRLEHAALAFDEILPARTFIFADELSHFLRSAGEKTIDPNSGLLLASNQEEAGRAKALWKLPEASDEKNEENHDFHLIYPGQYRMANEPACHKILDLMGDLALNHLQLPKLAIHAKNAGHAKHHTMLSKIQKKNPIA